jgi:PmbA protein
LNIVCEKFELQNTRGLKRSEDATYVSGVINADSEHGSSPVSGIGQANSRTLADFDAHKIGHDAAQMCSDSINPQKCETETTSVIFDPLAVGELLSFVITPNFSLKTYSEKKSCFSEKIGTRIATTDFSLLDDPHSVNGLGSKSFDDEGVETQIAHYIRNGVFENTYADSYNAFKEDSQSSANACRIGSPLGRSAAPIPVAAPHNLTIKAGKTERDEIIKDTKNGILVGRLWYTYAVNPIKGDFSCTARSGIWIIRNGNLASPAKSVRIIHSLPALLQNISAIASNQRAVLSWAAMPVTAPTIRCDGIPIVPI